MSASTHKPNRCYICGVEEGMPHHINCSRPNPFDRSDYKQEIVRLRARVAELEKQVERMDKSLAFIRESLGNAFDYIDGGGTDAEILQSVVECCNESYEEAKAARSK